MRFLVYEVRYLVSVHTTLLKSRFEITYEFTSTPLLNLKTPVARKAHNKIQAHNKILHSSHRVSLYVYDSVINSDSVLNSINRLIFEGEM
jgi:hypothetical protein